MRVFLSILIFAALGACSHNAFSPPARPMALESPATVAKGQTAARGNTLGLTVGAGIRVPVERYAVLLGLTSTQLWDRDSSGGYMGLGGGVETRF